MNPVRTRPESRKQLAKIDVIRCVAQRLGYRRYLELSTTTTGFCFGDAQESGFEECQRLMYKCPADFSDGQPIHFRSPNLDISVLLEELTSRSDPFDAIVVDPHHTYECSWRDIDAALSLAGRGGVIVVHDCNPRSQYMASPEFRPGSWCGVTYKAFLDIVWDRRSLRHCTVDTDWGCGVILTNPPDLPAAMASVFEATDDVDDDLIDRWRAIRNDDHAAYELFSRRKGELLNLVSGEVFLSAIGAAG